MDYLLNGNLTVDEAARMIDEDIAARVAIVSAQQAAIVALKTRKNLLAPISRLPAEVMSIIFSFVKLAEARHLATKSNERQQKVKWHIVSHVCSHWREIVINTASLWADPPFHVNASWLAEMLARSKMIDLTIDVKYYTYDRRHYSVYASNFEQIIRRASQIKYLSIQWLHQQSILDGFIASTPPSRLETLCISGSWEEFYTRTSIISIPSSMLLKTGSLRKLELSLCQFDIDSFSPNHITYLKLNEIVDIKYNRPNLKQLNDLLKKLPDLENLVLGDIFSSEHPRANAMSNDLHLSQLKVLHMFNIKPVMCELFKCITFPASTKVTVRTNRPPRSARAYRDFKGVLECIARFYPTVPLKFRALHLRHNSSNIELNLFTDTWDTVPWSNNKFCPPKAPLNITLDLSHYKTNSSTAKALNNVLDNGFSFDRVSHLLFTCQRSDKGLTSESLVCALKRLPALSSISVQGPFAQRVMSALQPPPADDEYENNENRYPYCFPNLKSIYFYGATIKYRNPGAGELNDEVDPVLLKSCLIYWKRNSTVKLDEICFKGCKISEDIRSDLQQFAEKIARPRMLIN